MSECDCVASHSLNANEGYGAQV